MWEVRLAKGKDDPAFRTKPQLAVEPIDATVEAGSGFRAVVSDCFSGEHHGVQTALWGGALPHMMGLRAHRGSWASADDPHTPADAAHVVSWDGPRQPGGWTPVVRRFRDGHRETWWAVDLRLIGLGWDQQRCPRPHRCKPRLAGPGPGKPLDGFVH